MKITPVLLMSVLVSVTCKATDLTTTSGQTYSNVTIKRSEAHALVVMTKTGIIRVPFSRLSPEVQKQYGYDPTPSTNAPSPAVVVAPPQEVTTTGPVIIIEAPKRPPDIGDLFDSHYRHQEMKQRQADERDLAEAKRLGFDKVRGDPLQRYRAWKRGGSNPKEIPL